MSEEKSKNSVLKIRNLKKSFGTNHVLKGFNMDLFQGESLAILGKSGSGKSVLIKCIIGLIQPDDGQIMVLGKDVQELDAGQLDQLRIHIGFLFQSNALYDSMTVRENLEFPLRRHWFHKNQSEVDQLIKEALEAVGLGHTQEMMPAELSGGMRKRIALARTLILKPEIILYDEPTTGLDPVTGREISHLMTFIQKQYRTSSIIISHDMNCIKQTCDRVILLLDGIAYLSGNFEELKQSSDPRIKEFFN